MLKSDSTNKLRSLRILGIRGIPAQHGGFETFAECLALYLNARGWDITVYCQTKGEGKDFDDHYQGIRRHNIYINQDGPFGTVVFDWRAVCHAAKFSDLVLTLGYNTAIFGIVFRLSGIVHLINMDGIEWHRKKWTPLQKTWLYVNERCACWFGNHLIADHPEIKAHHASNISPDKITMIPYGANFLLDADADAALLAPYDLTANQYAIVIARAEPENSILEIVEAFSRKPRGISLVVLGQYEPGKNAYHKKVMAAASDEVKFVGAIYGKPVINSLRYHARLYIHGHTVGGTNPSLVEALGASLPVLAHGNKFNRWVTGTGANFFKSADECAQQLDLILDDERALSKMKAQSIKRFNGEYGWPNILAQYESLLTKWTALTQNKKNL